MSMRSDGAATFYLIQHEQKAVNGTHPTRTEWVTSNLETFLFWDLPYGEVQGEVGNHYRELLRPQSANSDLWQKYGINGFVELADAEKAFFAVRNRNKDRRFRIIKRTIMQQTEVLVGGRYS
jgi:hypothetical protein